MSKQNSKSKSKSKVKNPIPSPFIITDCNGNQTVTDTFYETVEEAIAWIPNGADLDSLYIVELRPVRKITLGRRVEVLS